MADPVLAGRSAAARRLPEAYRLRPLREQFQFLLDVGLSPVDARMALVPRICLRAAEELEAAWRKPAGALRRESEREVLIFWREFWGQLHFHLDAAEHEAACRLIDRAIARVEPFGLRAGSGGGN